MPFSPFCWLECYVKAGAGAASVDSEVIEMEAVHSKTTEWKGLCPWLLKEGEPLAGPEHLCLDLHLS